MKKVVFMALLYLVPRLLSAQELDLASLAGKEWYGLYMNGVKVGYSENELSIAADGSVTVVEAAIFKLQMSGVNQDMGIFSKRLYGADGGLLRIESRVDDISGTNTFEAVVHGDTMTLNTRVGGQSRSIELPRPKESLRDVVEQLELLGGDPKPGDTVEFNLFEPMYELEIAGRSVILGVEERFLEGVATKVFKIKTTLDTVGIDSVSYVTEQGLTLEDHLAGGIITMRLESEAVAKDVTYTNDVIVSNAAHIEAPIAHARDLETLVLKLSGPLEARHLFNDARQSITARGDHYVFVGRKRSAEDIESTALPIENEAVTKWIEPSLFVQSGNPRLVNKAAEIIGDEKNALEISERLARWVYRNVRTTYSARLTNALEVLENMEGDCTEHSMLFIGLARAAGLPAREVAGLVYAEMPRPGFYFHQWARVWVGEWIDVDPTFDQPIADATHIKLAEGDLLEQIKLLPVIGQLAVEVMEKEKGS